MPYKCNNALCKVLKYGIKACFYGMVLYAIMLRARGRGTAPSAKNDGHVRLGQGEGPRRIHVTRVAVRHHASAHGRCQKRQPRGID
jgi:hypothetical protein